jgi:hypothetical protein
MRACPIRFAASRAAVSTRASTWPGTPHAATASATNRSRSVVIASVTAVFSRPGSSDPVWSPLFRPPPRAACQGSREVIVAGPVQR